MLEVSHGCPACGQVHEGRKFGFKHRAPRECPLVVMGSFPVVSLPSPLIDAPIKVPTAPRVDNPAPRRDPDALLAQSLQDVKIASSRYAERTRGLGVPWLPPPDLGEVL